MMARAGDTVIRAARSHWAGAFAIFVLLAILHTWPLATNPGVLSRNDNGDAQLNEWIIAWVAHQLPRDPLHLFEGNIFYPAHNTLAYSEPLIVPGVLAMPLWWLGGSAVLLFNVMLIAAALVASYVPARRAAAIDPMIALRVE